MTAVGQVLWSPVMWIQAANEITSAGKAAEREVEFIALRNFSLELRSTNYLLRSLYALPPVARAFTAAELQQGDQVSALPESTA